MKNLLKMMVLMSGLLPVLGINFAMAANNNIPELDNLDLGELAQQAASDNKQLMVVYYNGTCLPCEQLGQAMNTLDKDGVQLTSDFVLYKTNVSAGFQVVCPNGEQFAEAEFMAVKGITGLPAVVITDGFGNVMHVENNVTNKGQLVAASERYKKQNIVKNELELSVAPN